MKVIEHEHLDYIAGLYDSVLNPSGWRDSLTEFCGFINAGGSSLHVMDSRYDAASLTYFGGLLNGEIQKEYNELYAAVDSEALAVLFADRQRRFVHDFEAIGLSRFEDIERHPPIKWLSGKTGLFWRVASRLNLTGVWIDAITFQFKRGHGPMTDSEKAFCMPFLVHFAKVVELGRLFRILEDRFRTVVAALDRLNIGLLVVLHDARVVLSNAEAERIVDTCDGITFGRGKRLMLSDRSANDQLQRSVAELSATAAGSGCKSEQIMTVSRSGGADSLLLSVAPIRDKKGDTLDRITGAMVMLIDPENRESLSAAGMDALFKLTTTEHEVLQRLLDGFTTIEIAEDRRRSIETIRTQIKNILAKTNTKTKTELVRLAVSVNLPIKPS